MKTKRKKYKKNKTINKNKFRKKKFSKKGGVKSILKKNKDKATMSQKKTSFKETNDSIYFYKDEPIDELNYSLSFRPERSFTSRLKESIQGNPKPKIKKKRKSYKFSNGQLLKHILDSPTYIAINEKYKLDSDFIKILDEKMEQIATLLSSKNYKQTEELFMNILISYIERTYKNKMTFNNQISLHREIMRNLIKIRSNFIENKLNNTQNTEDSHFDSVFSKFLEEYNNIILKKYKDLDNELVSLLEPLKDKLQENIIALYKDIFRIYVANIHYNVYSYYKDLYQQIFGKEKGSSSSN